MSPENTPNATGDLKQEPSVTRSDLDNAAPKDPPPAVAAAAAAAATTTTTPQEPQSIQETQSAKESYEDYIKNLPPPFWQTKTPQAKPTSQDAIAARIKAVSAAPATIAEQREEDERLKAMSWRERWRDRKARREAEKKDRDRDLRPVERGSRAQLNVFGSNVREKK